MLHEEVSVFMKVSDVVTACLNAISDIGDEAGRSVLPVDTLHMDICLAFESFQENMSICLAFESFQEKMSATSKDKARSSE